MRASLLLTIFGFPLLGQPAFAGSVTLIADGNWCCVEVRSGNLRPVEANPVVRSGPVSPGVVFQGQEDADVCYRRERRQGDRSSGVSQSFNCDSNNLSGNEEFHIQ